MNEAARGSSLIIDSVARALAEWTVTSHHETDRTLAQRYGPTWRTDWVADVQQRLHHLAQAVAVRRPAVFVETVSWAGTAFAARDVAPEDLSQSLACMRQVAAAELPEPVGATAADYIDQAIGGLGGARAANGHIDAAHPLGELMLKYLESLLEGRRAQAGSLVLGAADGGTDIRDLYMSVLQAAQVEIGRMWHRGEISVADEHFATATTEHVMSLLSARSPDRPSRNRRVVASAVAGDLHCLGVRMVAEFFEMDGWDVIYLGADMPAADVIGAVAGHRAHVLALSATSFLGLRGLGELIDAVRRAADVGAPKVIVGGAPFRLVPDLHEELGADATAPSAPEAVALANRLLSTT